jgi:hypothetical protein
MVDLIALNRKVAELPPAGVRVIENLADALLKIFTRHAAIAEQLRARSGAVAGASRRNPVAPLYAGQAPPCWGPSKASVGSRPTCNSRHCRRR